MRTLALPLQSVTQIIVSGAPGIEHLWHMNETESASKFDGLVSAGTLFLQGNKLDRVPSLKKCQSLTFITLAFNKITQIRRGDFDGATKLLQLSLSGNAITSVAPSAFQQLTAMRLEPVEYNERNKNFRISIGNGACATKHAECGAVSVRHSYCKRCIGRA